MPKFAKFTKFTAVAVAAMCTFAACGSEPAPPTPQAPPSAQTPPASASADAHAHEAPHGGVLVELGDHFGFLEFVLDAGTGTLTAYVLDGGAEQAVRIAQPTLSLVFEAPAALAGQTVTLTGKANVLTGETVGDTSEFALTHDALKGQSSLTARVVELSVKGQTFHGLAIRFPGPT